MITWADKSDRGSRFFVAECNEQQVISIEDSIQFLFDFMLDKIIGYGNAVKFEVLKLEINCDTGRIISSAATLDGISKKQIDACSIRVQEIQDFWYDMIDKGFPEENYAELITEKINSIADLFKFRIEEILCNLFPKTIRRRFSFVVYGSNPGAIISEIEYTQATTT